MKLSEAIRLGAMASGYASGVFWDAHGNTCAQGAALLAIGRLDRSAQAPNHDHMEEAWPWAATTTVTCPACGAKGSVKQVIAHLNNGVDLVTFFSDGIYTNHAWPRERVADWVATVEPAEATEPLTPPVTDVTVAARGTHTPKEAQR